MFVSSATACQADIMSSHTCTARRLSPLELARVAARYRSTPGLTSLSSARQAATAPQAACQYHHMRGAAKGVGHPSTHLGGSQKPVGHNTSSLHTQVMFGSCAIHLWRIDSALGVFHDLHCTYVALHDAQIGANMLNASMQQG